MKIVCAIAAAAASLSVGFVDARIISSSDAYYWNKEPLGSTMWLFNSDGVQIYSNDGKELKKTVTGVPPNWYEVQSDGHQYVWVANLDRVEVFDIDTGDYAGYVPSCGNPAMELRYLPTRQEMWLRCARSTDDEGGNIDVFSTNSLSSNHPGIAFPGGFNYGWGLEVHSTLGNSGYAAPYNADYLYEIDLSSKEIIANYSFPEGVHSTYELTYSPANKHIYGKARVCCSCYVGDTNPNGADIACPTDRTGNVSFQQVIVATGPSASPNPQQGQCGPACEGSVADTIGVFEFDTVSKTYAATHNGKANNGATAMSSPDGKYVVLGTHDGGDTIRVLKAGNNGVPATLAADIAVEFGGDAGQETVGDVAFIEDENRNFMVIAGWGNNELAVIDLDDDFRMVKIMLTDNPELTASGERNVEWAVGTDYVWIDGPQTGEMYIVEIGSTIDSAKVSNVIEAKGGFVIHVDNYERAALAAMVGNMKGDHSTGDMKDDKDTGDMKDDKDTGDMKDDKDTGDMKDDKATGDMNGDQSTSSQANAAKTNDMDEENDSTQAVAVAGLIVGALALLWVMALTVSVCKSSSDEPAKEERNTGADVVTLGSKQAV